MLNEGQLRTLYSYFCSFIDVNETEESFSFCLEQLPKLMQVQLLFYVSLCKKANLPPEPVVQKMEVLEDEDEKEEESSSEEEKKQKWQKYRR